MKYIIPALIAGLLLVGCAVTPPLKVSAPFVESDFQSSVGSGSATIAGSAFMKTRAGDVKVGAGNQVELIPATAYTKERFQIASQISIYTRMEPRDPRLAKYVRTTTADAQGNFEFRNVPAGEYILSCLIQWQYSTGSGSATTGGQALAFVSVAGDEVKKVVLTR